MMSRRSDGFGVGSPGDRLEPHPPNATTSNVALARDNRIRLPALGKVDGHLEMESG